MKKVIVITGTSHGFGQLATFELAQRGHQVYATMRDADNKNRKERDEFLSFAKEKKAALKVVSLDVTDEHSVQTAIDGIYKDAGRIDVLLNNAGAMNIGVTEAFTTEQVKQQFDVNVFGAVRTDRAVLPYMRQARSGLLLHVSSLAGRAVFPFFGAYCASKFALEALAEAYRYELSAFGIDSIIVEPGPFPSNLLPTSPAPSDEKRLSEYSESVKIADQIKDGFKQMYESSNPPRPMDVVDAFVRLIESTEKRPLRTVVMPTGMDFGVERLNQAITPIQNELLKSLGLANML